MHAPAPPDPAGALAQRYRHVRASTDRLVEPLTAEDCQVQSMDDASPTKWHLAHTSWFFETFVLERWKPGYRPFHPDFRVLFNSYYQSVGAQHPRPQRGLLSRPTLDEVRSYRAHVDAHVGKVLTEPFIDTECARVIELGLQHEQQHQELLLTDIKHALACNPLRPAYRAGSIAAAAAPAPLHWHAFRGGIHSVGHAGEGFAFDNELPQHRVIVEAFELAERTLTNGEYLAFMEDGGYERPELWLSDGWRTACERGWRAPLYWERREGGWAIMTLAGLHPLSPAEPVCHVSYYEADAVARWAAARLPTEAEWEVAAAGVPVRGNFVESGRLHPAQLPADEVAGPQQLFGDVWEWTQSPYVPYPGYRAPAGALGEYNGKFMCNQVVLRGGSCVTPASHLRPSYRNFFPPDARWQFSGVRLARNRLTR